MQAGNLHTNINAHVTHTDVGLFYRDLRCLELRQANKFDFNIKILFKKASNAYASNAF